jgi:hypothetical protein
MCDGESLSDHGSRNLNESKRIAVAAVLLIPHFGYQDAADFLLRVNGNTETSFLTGVIDRKGTVSREEAGFGARFGYHGLSCLDNPLSGTASVADQRLLIVRRQAV